MKTVKVLHIISGLETGGAEMALYRLLKYMSRSKVQSAVVCLGKSGFIGQQILAINIPLLCLDVGINGRNYIGRSVEFIKFVRMSRPNIIQGWMYHGNVAASFASFMCFPRAQVFWNVRQTLQSLSNESTSTRYAITLSKYISRRPKRIIYNSQDGQVQHERLGFSSRQSCVIPNGVDLDELFPDSNARRQIRNELGVNQDVVVIGHIGRYHPKKNHVGLLKAIKLVADKHDDVRFVLVGRGVVDDDPELKQIIQNNSLTERCLLLGERQDVVSILRGLDILVVSSAWGEGFPNVLSEAMATSLCCVSTDVGESSTILGSTGTIVRPNDSVELAKGICDTIALSADEKIKRGQRARARIMENYSIKSMSNLYEDQYHNTQSN